MFDYNKSFIGANFKEFKNWFLGDAEYNELEQEVDNPAFFIVSAYYGEEWEIKVHNGVIVNQHWL